MKTSGKIFAAALLALGASTAAASAQPRGYYGDEPRHHYGDGPRHYYGEECRDQNATAGTVIGAIAGGLLGAGVSHGNGGAAIGGVILGGLAGNAIGKNIDCSDRPYAWRAYDDGFYGPIGRRYEWRGRGRSYGYFVPVREYRDRGYVCREFRTTTYRHGRKYVNEGRACRERDGNWHMY
jgi:surface antigen